MQLPGNSSKSIVSSLVAKGADPMLKDREGKTVIDLAKAQNRDDLVALMTKTADTIATTTTTEPAKATVPPGTEAVQAQ